jgi:hypothetical protein
VVARPVGQRLLGARRQDDAPVQVLLGDPVLIVLRRRQLASRLRPHCSEAATMMPRQWSSFFRALGRQPHHAALRRQRLEAGHAQFDGLFDNPVHLAAFGQGLRQRHGNGSSLRARRGP